MRKKDVPCAGDCGQFVWRGNTRCQPCRRAARRADLPKPLCAACNQAFLPVGLHKTCSDACRAAMYKLTLAAKGWRSLDEPRQCEVCAAPYFTHDPTIRTCGRACGVELKRRSPKRYACETCGALFGAVSGSQRFCSQNCRKPRKPELPARQCRRCAEEFRPTHGSAKYCSRECSRLSNAEDCKALSKAKYAAAKAGDGLWRGRAIVAPAPQDLEKTCKLCQSTFVVATGGRGNSATRRLYCEACRPALARAKSDHRKRLRLARLRTVRREPYTLHGIAARDYFRCGLCFELVDMELRVPDRGAPTIDHLVPLALLGDDVPDNVQLAHFICNSKRGALDVDQARRRISTEAQWATTKLGRSPTLSLSAIGESH